MNFELLVKGGKVVTPTGVIDATLAVKEGRVAALLSPDMEASASHIVDATGQFIMPGGIDVHVHGGYGEPDRETLTTASMAAAAGGITTFLDQPLSQPSTVTLKAYQAKKADADKNCVVDIGLWGGLIPGHLADLKDVYMAGGQAYKAFMCRCSNYAMTDDGTLLAGMKQIAQWGGLVAVHAENDTLISFLEEKFAQEGRRDIEAFLEAHPVYSELEAIERFIFLANLAPGCKAHVVHMSIPQGAESIRFAKADGIDITVETCPQYLGLTDEDLLRIGGIAKCDPPVRSRELVDALWTYVLDGTIDMIASDHSPHLFSQKVVPVQEFYKAKQGCMGLQTMLPVVIDEGIIKRGMSLTQYARFTSFNAAKRFGLYPQKGHLTIGADADFYLLDLNNTWTCKAEETYYVNKHTPFDGRTFQGKINATYVRGQCVYDGQSIQVEPGYGRYIPLQIGCTLAE